MANQKNPAEYGAPAAATVQQSASASAAAPRAPPAGPPDTSNRVPHAPLATNENNRKTWESVHEPTHARNSLASASVSAHEKPVGISLQNTTGGSLAHPNNAPTSEASSLEAQKLKAAREALEKRQRYQLRIKSEQQSQAPDEHKAASVPELGNGTDATLTVGPEKRKPTEEMGPREGEKRVHSEPRVSFRGSPVPLPDAGNRASSLTHPQQAQSLPQPDFRPHVQAQVEANIHLSNSSRSPQQTSATPLPEPEPLLDEDSAIDTELAASQLASFFEEDDLEHGPADASERASKQAQDQQSGHGQNSDVQLDVNLDVDKDDPSGSTRRPSRARDPVPPSKFPHTADSADSFTHVKHGSNVTRQAPSPTGVFRTTRSAALDITNRPQDTTGISPPTKAGIMPASNATIKDSNLKVSTHPHSARASREPSHELNHNSWRGGAIRPASYLGR